MDIGSALRNTLRNIFWEMLKINPMATTNQNVIKLDVVSVVGQTKHAIEIKFKEQIIVKLDKYTYQVKAINVNKILKLKNFY